MELTFLGTGTSQGVPIIGCTCPVCTSSDPRDKRTRTSALVKTDNTVLLIDASPDLRYQLLKYHNQRHIDAVLLTHEHRDHVGGLDDLRPVIFEQGKPMDIFAHPRTLKAIQCIYYYSFEEKPYPGAPKFNLFPITNQPFKIKGIEIIPIRAMHYTMEIFGYRIGQLGYITDAKYLAPDEIEKLKGVKVLVVNALRPKLHYSHFNLDEALELIDKVKPGKAYLTHLSHKFPPHKEFAAALPKGVEPAYDGLTIQV